MCEDCLLTKRQAAQLIQNARDERGRDAHTTLLEHLIASVVDAGVNVDEVEVSEGEADEILDEIRFLY